jgi:hypothetical protein
VEVVVEFEVCYDVLAVVVQEEGGCKLVEGSLLFEVGFTHFVEELVLLEGVVEVFEGSVDGFGIWVELVVGLD